MPLSCFLALGKAGEEQQRGPHGTDPIEGADQRGRGSWRFHREDILSPDRGGVWGKAMSDFTRLASGGTRETPNFPRVRISHYRKCKADPQPSPKEIKNLLPFYFWLGEATPRSDQGSLLDLRSEITPGGAWGPYGMSGIKPGSTSNILPDILVCWMEAALGFARGWGVRGPQIGAPPKISAEGSV